MSSTTNAEVEELRCQMVERVQTMGAGALIILATDLWGKKNPTVAAALETWKRDYPPTGEPCQQP